MRGFFCNLAQRPVDSYSCWKIGLVCHHKLLYESQIQTIPNHSFDPCSCFSDTEKILNFDSDQVNFEPIKQINITNEYILDTTLLTLHTILYYIH